MRISGKYINILLWATIISLVTGIGLGYVGNRSISDKEKLTRVTRRLEKEVSRFQMQLLRLSTALNTNSSMSPFTEIKESLSNPFYLFEQGQVTYWSDNYFIPPYQDISGTKSLDFVEFRQGQFIVIKIVLSGVNRQLVGLIPIFRNSQIDNRHLHSSVNINVFTGNAVHISKYESELTKSPVCVRGQCLFYVGFTDNYERRNHALSTASFSWICVAILCLILLTVNLLLKDGFSIRGVLTFGFFLASLRLSMLWIGFPGRLITSKVFDPKLFASSTLNASSGDMFLNVLFILMFVVALTGILQADRLSISTIGQRWKVLWTVLLTTCSQFILFLQFLIIQTLYRNSGYSLDITQSINFSYDRVIVYMIFVLSAVLFFLFSHFCYVLIVRLHQHAIKRMWSLYGAGVLLFLITLIALDYPLFTVFLSILYFTIVTSLDLLRGLRQVNYFSFIYIFCAILISVALCTYAIHYFENDRIEKNKEKFATHFLIENDVLAEFLLAEAIGNISDDAFIRSRMFSPFISNKNAIREKIKKVHLNRYFDRYELKIRLYNNECEIYGTDSEDNYWVFKNSFDKKFKTSYKDLYRVNNSDANITRRYIAFVEIKNYGLTTGYVVMDFRLKKIIPDNVYLELLVDSRFLLPFENENYSYAIYNGGELLSHSGDFNYQNDFERSYLSKNKIARKNFDHLILEDHEGRKVVISSKALSWRNVASNFSFLLLILMFLVVLLLMIYAIYFYLEGRSFNYSARIQLYFNLAVFLPLFAVSVTTVSMVTASYEKEVEHEHLKEATLISRNLEEPLREFMVDSDQRTLENNLTGITGFSNSDANLFDTKGKLIATSQPLIYKKGVLAPYLATHAMRAIINQKQNHLTIGEQVGQLKYNTTYVAVNEPSTGNLTGVLSVLYFQSEFELEKEKIEVFTTILIIFTSVFMVFLVISYFTSKWLTFPLLFITQKLKKTTLYEKNEPLLCDSDDEIGLMVAEYNKMVVNMENSKKALARTQKESAWRQIAQQVAHEINNPVTPMKLTLQYLKRILERRPDLAQVQKPVDTLLSQVNTLSQISTSFSSFAKMPIPDQEQYDLTKVIKNTVALYENHQGERVTLALNDEQLYTVGDEQLTGRILSNIIINARQSAGKEPIKILVKLEVIDNKKLLITVTDNGMGIPEDIQEKVFIPNFTTKTSGSGIGLAIAKHGIEHSGGKIWFKTKTGCGTTFFIELPKVS